MNLILEGHIDKGTQEVIFYYTPSVPGVGARIPCWLRNLKNTLFVFSVFLSVVLRVLIEA